MKMDVKGQNLGSFFSTIPNKIKGILGSFGKNGIGCPQSPVLSPQSLVPPVLKNVCTLRMARLNHKEEGTFCCWETLNARRGYKQTPLVRFCN